MTRQKQRDGMAAYRDRAEAYFERCDAKMQSVTIGGFCRALDITLEMLKEWSKIRRREGESTKQPVFLDRFWTRYFAAAEAGLDGKETQAAAKFKLERLMPLFEGDDLNAGGNEITVRFDERVEPYSQ